MEEVKDVRKSVIAGSWYPGRKKELAAMVDGFLNNAKLEDVGKIKALIAPHAGYIYSGQVAAFSYKQIKDEGGKYKKVIILAPTHHVSFRGASIVDKTHYQTPLGDVKISEVVNVMKGESKLIFSIPEVDAREHSLEIQLPFLQRVLKEFEIIPLVVGQLSESDRKEIADLIIKHLDDETLIVASTDLSHYHPYDSAVEMDTECIDSIISLDIPKAEGCEMCGLNPVLITMIVAKKLNLKTKLLKYANSGDVTGDMSGVVGYAAIAFYTEEALSNPGNLSSSEKRYLLKLARDSIEDYVRGRKVIEPRIEDDSLKENLGVFVTLEKNCQLRGCIGHIRAIQPLYLDVRDNAINAAFNDPRFRPVSEEELDKIEIEVSVLTEPELIRANSPEEYLENIQEGIDGIIIEYSGRSATYLPQVWKQLPDKEKFLGSLCNKAGLKSNCWREKGVKIYRYKVQAFKESEFR